MKIAWEQAAECKLQVGAEITGGFDVGFEKGIPEETKDALMEFVYWVEDHFSVPVTLWVDFKYRHYLLDRSKKRAGYLFYWAAFQKYPVFENPDDIPVIELPVRMERYSLEEILISFIQGISCYYHWLSGGDMTTYQCSEEDALEILEAYSHRKTR